MGTDAPAMWFIELVASQIKELGSQRALADRVQVTQQTISNWKRAKTLPQPPEAVRFAIHLGVDPVAFIGRLWPEVDQADPLAQLRQILIGAPKEDIDLVLDFAAEAVGRKTPLSVSDLYP